MNKNFSALLSILIFPLITICMFYLFDYLVHMLTGGSIVGLIFQFFQWNFGLLWGNSYYILFYSINFLLYFIFCLLAGVVFKSINIKLSKAILFSVFVSSGITFFIPIVFYGYAITLLSSALSIIKLFIGAIIFIFIVRGNIVINQNDKIADWDKKFRN